MNYVINKINSITKLLELRTNQSSYILAGAKSL